MTYQVQLAIKGHSNQCTQLSLTLTNHSDQTLTNFELHFAYRHRFDKQSLNFGELVQIGSYCVLSFPHNYQLPAQQSLTIELCSNAPEFLMLDDGINDAFILCAEKRLAVDIPPIEVNLIKPTLNDSNEINQINANPLGVIPTPNSLVINDGTLDLTRPFQFLEQNIEAKAPLNWLQQELAKFPRITNTDKSVVTVECHTLKEGGRGEYQLEIKQDNILMQANCAEGYMYACATLVQLIAQHLSQPEPEQHLSCLVIKDKPRFNHRGMMLDCARHFHDIEQVKALINQLAYYKMNVFHWHLTDDEGWRIEINAFPELTKIGAWRGQKEVLEPQYSHLSDDSYGGFYSQKQIKEVIEYAKARQIMVIPEIDIPGHCRAAIKALPHLLHDANDASQYISVQHYTDNVLSPALDGTYTFLDTVLEEIVELFPAPFVHIGADEVPEGVWTQSRECTELMKKQGYTDTKELQGHILRYAENKLASLGKRMIGWEEVQHGDKVSQNTIVCSWLSEEAGLGAVKKGFDVIMQPAQFTYFDIAQDQTPDELGANWAGINPLEKTYHYQPLAQLAADDPARQHIVGIQCGLWCELIDSPQRLEFMVYPRLLALADVCWRDPNDTNWQDFLARLKAHLPCLDKQGIGYRKL